MKNSHSKKARYSAAVLRLFVFATLTASALTSRSQNFQWGKVFGATNSNDYSSSVKTDASGNYYVAGYFQSVVDFDPGPAVTTLTANGYDVYISKFDNAGNFVWVKHIGGSGDGYVTSIELSSSGNINIIGFFDGTVDFDPGSATFNLSSTSCWEGYAMSLNSSGNFLWAKKFGSTTSSCVYPASIDVDGSGNIFAVGHYQGTADFDPGAGTAFFSSNGSTVYDAFVLKLDANGSYVWAKTFGGNAIDQAEFVRIDGTGNVLVGGFFLGTADFDPSGSTNNLSANGGEDGFVLKLSSAGSFVWARSLGGTLNERVHSVAVDAGGNVYSTGQFQGTVDFNPGAGTFTMSALSNAETFILKLNSSGTFVWSKEFDGNLNTGLAIDLDANANVYTAGYYTGAVDFNPGTSVLTQTSQGNIDPYVISLDSAGGFLSSSVFGGSGGSEYGYAIDVSGTGSFVVAGYLTGTADLDAGPGVTSYSTGSGNSSYFAKFTCAPSPAGAIAGSSTVCGNTTNQYTASVIPGATSYSWTVPSGASITSQSNNSVQVMSGATSGQIVLTPVNACGVGLQSSFSVNVQAAPVVVLGSGTICSGQSFTISTSGASSYTFLNGGPAVSPTVTTTYSVVGTHTNGCSSNAVTQITVSPRPVISVNNGSICSGQTFTFSPSGASTYTFASNAGNFSPTVTTSYSVTGTSTAGCVSSNTAVATLSVHARPSIAVNSGTICTGQTFTMNPTGALTYTYSSGTPTVVPLSNSSYSVTGTSAQGCVSSSAAVAQVTVHARPVIAVNSGTICSGQVFTLVPSGAVSYTFSGGSATVSPSATTSYSVTGTNSLGCSSAGAAVAGVTVHALPVLSLNSGTICSGGTFTLIPSGAATYTYSGGSSTVAPVVTTTYSVLGTSSLGCIAQSPALSTVTVHARPVITVNSGSICTGQIFTMTPSGASTYSFSNGSSTAAPTANTAYSVTGTGANGCLSGTAAVASVTVHALPVVSVNSGSICSGDTFTISPTGAASYSYTGGSNLVSPATNTSYAVTGTSSVGCLSSNTAIASVTVSTRPVVSVNSGTICAGQSFTILPSGASTYSVAGTASVVSPPTHTTYAVVGYNNVGCSSSNTAVVTLSVFPNPTITVAAASNPICAGDAVNIVATGSDTYTWSTNSTNAMISVSPLTNTVYFVNGTSLAGCSAAQQSISIAVNPTPTVSVSGQTVVCAGDPATLTATGAQSYTWNTNHFTNTIVVNPSFTTGYQVMGTNSFGCAAIAAFTVNVNALPFVSVNGPQSICSGTSATLTAAGAVTYSWSPFGGVGNPVTVAPTVSTQFTVSGTDANGCKGLAIQNVIVNPSPTVIAIPSSTAVCPGSTVSLMGSGASSYTWSGGILDNTSFTITTGKTFTVIGEDGGCTDTAVIAISVLALPVMSVSASPTLICEGETATLTAGGAQQYSWSSGDSGASTAVTPQLSNSYSVTGTGVNGCSATASIYVTVNLCTGANENRTVQLRIFPNPNSGSFYVSASETSDIVIYNEIGQCVYNKKAVNGEIQISSLAKGIYFVTASTPSERRTVRLVVTE